MELVINEFIQFLNQNSTKKVNLVNIEQYLNTNNSPYYLRELLTNLKSIDEEIIIKWLLIN